MDARRNAIYLQDFICNNRNNVSDIHDIKNITEIKLLDIDSKLDDFGQNNSFIYGNGVKLLDNMKNNETNNNITQDVDYLSNAVDIAYGAYVKYLDNYAKFDNNNENLSIDIEPLYVRKVDIG